jgi:two-component system OmpR family sensor kinase
MSIRSRLALVCGGATLLLLLGGGFVFLQQLRTGLDHNLDTTLRARADAVIAGLTGTEGSDFPDTGPGSLLHSSDVLGQVVTVGGTIEQSSDTVGTQPLLTPAELATAARRPLTLDRRVTLQPTAVRDPADSGKHSVRLLAAPSGRPDEVVVVGTSREVVDAAVTRAGQQLLGLGGAVLLLAAVGGYLLARAALRPVERMRREADELGAHDAGEGLAVPATRDEVARLAETMNALLSRLHRALGRERDFVADAGHELRTPLAILKGELELAQRPGRSQGDLRATVDVAARETDRLIRLSDDLLMLARSTEGLALRRTEGDLREVAGDAVEASRARAAQVGVMLALDAPAPVVVAADCDRVRQALDNLLGNALQHAPPGSTVTVALRRDTRGTTVTVLDEGPGFTRDFLPVAFERFRRSDAARTRRSDAVDGEGSGLGLAIVRSIAAAHGGTAAAANRPGAGAAVSFTLPDTTQPFTS